MLWQSKNYLGRFRKRTETEAIGLPGWRDADRAIHLPYCTSRKSVSTVHGETTPFGIRIFLVFAVLLMAARVARAEDALVDPGGWRIHRELLPNNQNHSKVIELFWTKPDGNAHS
jgi:hypothetical protein